MKRQNVKNKTISILLAGTIFLASCASTTTIQSNPSGAKLYLNNEFKGETPYRHRDSKIVFTTTDVKLTKEGYKDYFGSFSRDEKADAAPIIVGFFFMWPLWLWAMKYDPMRTYEMEPVVEEQKTTTFENKVAQPTKSKTDRLRELKKLLDEKILTQEEYDAEKKKILAEDEN